MVNVTGFAIAFSCYVRITHIVTHVVMSIRPWKIVDRNRGESYNKNWFITNLGPISWQPGQTVEWQRSNTSSKNVGSAGPAGTTFLEALVQCYGWRRSTILRTILRRKIKRRNCLQTTNPLASVLVGGELFQSVPVRHVTVTIFTSNILSSIKNQETQVHRNRFNQNVESPKRTEAANRVQSQRKKKRYELERRPST